MATWDASFEASPAGSDLGSTLDDRIRDLKVEIRKRLEDIIDNWSGDPDSTTMDLKIDIIESRHIADDAVIAEHISGLTGSGAITLDNIPTGTTNKYVSNDYIDDDGKVDSVKESGGKRLIPTVIDIGDWNLQSTTNIDLDSIITTAGISLSKIRSISIVLRDDTNAVFCPIGINDTTSTVWQDDLGVDIIRVYYWISGITWRIYRSTSGTPTWTDWNATSYNRGWITVWCEE